MNYKTYLENVSEKLSCNFDFMENKGFEGILFDLAAKSHIRNEKYIVAKKAVIYAYENNEYCFFKTMDEVRSNDVNSVFDTIKKVSDDFVVASDEHMSTTFTGIIITEKPVDADTVKMVKKLKYQKAYRLGFHGWCSIRIIIVELDSKKVISSREAKKVSKFYEAEQQNQGSLALKQ